MSSPVLELFHGQLTPQSAHVYARVSGLPADDLWSLQGKLRGPECQYAKTLPGSFSFADLGSRPCPLARAVLTDPCYWSPDMPALYQVTLQLKRGTEVVASYARLIGVPHFGAHGKNLYRDGKRWVIRGIPRREETVDAWQELRELGATLCATNPSDSFCERSSREGVQMVAYVDVPPSELLDQLRRLAEWPSVVLALVSSSEFHAQDWPRDSRPPNLLLGWVASGERSTVPEWADVLVVSEDRLPRWAASEAVRSRPTFVTRPVFQAGSIGDARAACDGLQRDVVRFGDFAGYLVDFGGG